jgi:hypothetical protein
MSLDLHVVAEAMSKTPFGPGSPGEPSPTHNVERLIQQLEGHALSEARSIELYRRLSHSNDPVVRFVMSLVLEDEEHHHALIERMVARLRDDALWTHSPNAVPVGDGVRLAETDPLVSSVTAHRLAEDERCGEAAIWGLAREARGLHQGVLTLLLELLANDSEKHRRALTFVEGRLAARERLAGHP